MIAAVALAKSPEGKKREEMEAVFAEHYPIIFRVCSRILRDEVAAEDAAQETFLNAWKSIGSFRGDAKIKTWLIRIAANVCFAALRGSSVKHPRQFEEIKTLGETVSGEDLLPASSNPFCDFVVTEFHDRLETCLGDLKSHDREVIYMRYIMELSEREASERLNLPVLSARSRLFRASHRLRDELRKVGYHNSSDLSRSPFEC